MNNTYIPQTLGAAESAQRILTTGMESIGTLTSHQSHHTSGAVLNGDIAQRILRLTGSVRLASRSASGRHWHHCGINE